jgi:hypothetical protein
VVTDYTPQGISRRPTGTPIALLSTPQRCNTEAEGRPTCNSIEARTTTRGGTNLNYTEIQSELMPNFNSVEDQYHVSCNQLTAISGVQVLHLCLKIQPILQVKMCRGERGDGGQWVMPVRHFSDKR